MVTCLNGSMRVLLSSVLIKLIFWGQKTQVKKKEEKTLMSFTENLFEWGITIFSKFVFDPTLRKKV